MSHARKDPVTVLVTCVASQVIPSVIQLIRNHPLFDVRVIGIDTRREDESVGASFCDAFYQAPMGDAPGYGMAVEEIIRREGVRFIYPGSDEEVRTIAGIQDRLGEKYGCKLASSREETVVLASDKLAMLKFLEERGVATPKFAEPQNVSDIRRMAGEIGFPDIELVMKPKVSRGSRGLHIVRREVDPKQAFYRRDSSDITLDQLIGFFEAYPAEVCKFVMMEYLPGDKYSSDVLASKGAAAAIVTRCNGPVPKLNPPTQLADIVFDEDVRAYAEAVARTLGVDYFIQVETGRDREGKVKYIETNPRLDATLSITTGLGLNYYHELLTYAMTGSFSPRLNDRPLPAPRLRYFRYWQHIFTQMK